MRLFLLLLVCFSNIFICFAQESLTFSYTFLEKKVSHLKEKPSEQFRYIRKMIDKSKWENDLKMLHRSYSLASTYTRGDEQLKYGDSLLMTAYKQNDPDIIGDCYLAKGAIFMNEEKYTEALRNFVQGYEFIKKKNSPYLVHNAEYLIAQTKIYLGQYKEAHDILGGVVSFFRINHSKVGDTDYALYYLYSLISYIDTNSHLGHFEENEKLIREGVYFIEKNHYPNYFCYFVSLEGTDAFYQKRYDDAIRKLKEALKLYNDNWKHLTETYYLGMSYWNKGDKDKAVGYFLKISNEYISSGKLDPQFRPAIEHLINYYKERNDAQKQLEYVNQLISLDRIYERDYRELFSTLNKVYDTPKLNETKDKLEIALANAKKVRILLILTIILLAVISWIAYRYFLRQKYYKMLYAQMYKMNEVGNTAVVETSNTEKETSHAKMTIIDSELSEINPLVIESILAYLENFESKKKFLDKDVSIKSMALECCTNKSYLSKIINHYKNEHFVSYLNNLRLNYVVEQWKVNPKTRYLPIQELAEKTGFSTAQSFSRNFREKYGISPSYFLKRLDKESELKAS